MGMATIMVSSENTKFATRLLPLTNMWWAQTIDPKSVKQHLAKHGIDPARLIGKGVGPLAPVDTNSTEEGRAKNRRVELVKQ